MRSCASISGTVSGIGTATSAGSTPDATDPVVPTSGDGVGSGVAAAAAAGTAGIASGIAVITRGAAGGSFEKPSKVKSNRCSESPGLKDTFADI